MDVENADLQLTQPYSDATLRDLDRALWTYPFSKLTDERAKRLFTLCAASLLWCAGLIDDGSIKYLGMQIGASARLVNWVALGLVAYAFAQWFISKQRDQKHWKLSISDINEPLADQLLSPIREVESKVAERNARHARYAPKIKQIEDQLADLAAEYAKPIAEAKEKTELEIQNQRDVSDGLEDALESLQSLEESLRLRQDVLTRKRQWYRARCVLGNETMRQIASAVAPKFYAKIDAVHRKGERIGRLSLAVEIMPVYAVFIVTFLWLILHAVKLSA
jgi:signal transduction histidine kinase